MRSLFDPDALVWRTLAQLVDVVGLSLLWAALCLPVVTIGPATAALYHTAAKVVRRGQDKAFAVCLRAFWSNLKQGIAATLICLGAAAAFVCGFFVMRANAVTRFGAVVYAAYFVALVVPAGVICWLFPLMSRFDMKLGALFQTAFLLAMRQLPATVVVVAAVYFAVDVTAQLWWPVFFTPMAAALLASLFMERAFRKYQ